MMSLDPPRLRRQAGGRPLRRGRRVTIDRNAQWKRVWDRKGDLPSAHLHHVNGYDLLSAPEWDEMVRKVSAPLAMRRGDAVIECGCGAGAFLAALVRLYPGIRVSGIDYSPSLLRRAAANLAGRFEEGDIRQLGFLPAAAYDHVLSFGVFPYLNSLADAEQAVREMARLVRPGGTLTVGEVSDAAKREEALEIRHTSHRDQPRVSTEDLDHLYVPKSLFERLAAELGFALRIVDHTAFALRSNATARYRFTAYFRSRPS